MAKGTKAYPNYQCNLTIIAKADEWYIQKAIFYCTGLKPNLFQMLLVSVLVWFGLVLVLLIFSMCTFVYIDATVSIFTTKNVAV